VQKLRGSKSRWKLLNLRSNEAAASEGRSSSEATSLVPIGRDPAGKRRYVYETFYGTAKAAQTRLTELLSQKDKGTIVEPSKTTVNEYLDRWLKDAVKGRVGPHSYADYEALFEASRSAHARHASARSGHAS